MVPEGSSSGTVPVRGTLGGQQGGGAHWGSLGQAWGGRAWLPSSCITPPRAHSASLCRHTCSTSAAVEEPGGWAVQMAVWKVNTRVASGLGTSLPTQRGARLGIFK